MRLFDTHCHLTDERFDEDRDETIARMREAGVARALLVGDGSQEAQPVSSPKEADIVLSVAGGGDVSLIDENYFLDE